MALINCPECSKEVSDQAATCPNCGITINQQVASKNKKKIPKIIPIFIIGFIMLGGIGTFVGIQVHNANVEKERIAAEEQRAEEERVAEEARIAAETQYEGDITSAFALMRYWGLVSELQQEYVGKIWRETIDGGKYGISFNDPDTGKSTKSFTDFNDTIRWWYGLEVTKSLMKSLSENDIKMAEYMISLQNPPDKFNDAYGAFLDMYEIYVQTSNLAQSPSGSLQTFNSTRNTLSANFSSAYARVKVLLPEVEKKVSEIEEDIE